MRSKNLLAGIAAMAMAAGPACAHAILVESTPGINATLPAGRIALMLRFNSRIDAARSRVTLIDTAGSEKILEVAAGGRPDQLAGRFDLPPGAWRVHWQVLAVDGHITRGEVPFTLTSPVRPLAPNPAAPAGTP